MSRMPAHPGSTRADECTGSHRLILHGCPAPCVYMCTQVRQMESEVVSMTASFLGGGPGTSVCGAMTSGKMA